MALDAFLTNLALGLSVAATMQNLMWCLAGAVIGTAVGVLGLSAEELIDPDRHRAIEAAAALLAVSLKNARGRPSCSSEPSSV